MRCPLFSACLSHSTQVASQSFFVANGSLQKGHTFIGMLIGLKLDIGFERDETCRRLYGEREILPFLRELGIGAVETPVGPQTQPEVLKEHIRRCVDAGMKVSLHPYSEASIFNPAHFSPEPDNPCRELHERFQAGEPQRRKFTRG